MAIPICSPRCLRGRGRWIPGTLSHQICDLTKQDIELQRNISDISSWPLHEHTHTCAQHILPHTTHASHNPYVVQFAVKISLTLLCHRFSKQSLRCDLGRPSLTNLRDMYILGLHVCVPVTYMFLLFGRRGMHLSHFHSITQESRADEGLRVCSFLQSLCGATSSRLSNSSSVVSFRCLCLPLPLT